MLSRIATGTSDPRHPNPARAHTGTWGRGDVQTTVAAWHPTAIHCSRSDVRPLLGRPRRPRVPLVDVTAELSESVNAVSRTEHLNRGALARRHNVHSVAFVRADVEALSEHTPDPPIGDGSLKVDIEALAHLRCYVRDRDD